MLSQTYLRVVFFNPAPVYNFNCCDVIGYIKSDSRRSRVAATESIQRDLVKVDEEGSAWAKKLNASKTKTMVVASFSTVAS